MTQFKIRGNIGNTNVDRTVSVQSALISAVEAEMSDLLGDLKKVIGKKTVVAGEKVAYYHKTSVYIEVTKIKK